MSVCVFVCVSACMYICPHLSSLRSLSPPTTCVVRIKSDSACCLALALAVLSRLRARAPTAALFVEPSLSLSLSHSHGRLPCVRSPARCVCVRVCIGVSSSRLWILRRCCCCCCCCWLYKPVSRRQSSASHKHIQADIKACLCV